MIIKTYKLIPQEKEIMLENITTVEYKYIQKIEEYKKKYKKVPTVRKICCLMSAKSTATVFYMLKLLKKKGYFYDAI